MKDHEIARLRELLTEPGPEEETTAREEAETIWRAAAGELSPDETAAVLDRALSSPEDAEAWALAAAIRAGAEAAGENPSASGSPAGSRTARWILLAAAAVVVVGIALPFLVRGPGDGTVFRGEGNPAGSSLLAEGAAVPRDAVLLRWTPGPEGSTYDVVVSREDLEPVLEAHGLKRSELHVPAAALASLPDGALLLWQVTVHTPEGTEERSATHTIRLTGGEVGAGRTGVPSPPVPVEGG